MVTRANPSIGDGGTDRSTLSCALACLADPPTLIAIGLLLLNDHVLKAAVPSWWTGKLSDLAGLYFFPFLLLAALGLLEGICPRRFRSKKRAMTISLIVSGAWFAALKATPVSNAWAVTSILSVLLWVLLWRPIRGMGHI